MSATAAPARSIFSPEYYFEQWMSFNRKLLAIPTVFEVAQRVQVGATPTRTICREDGCRLLRYESDVAREVKTPLLFVFALVNRPYILDLRPEKSVVSQFLKRGFDVYNMDWGVPADGDRFLGLEDYVLRYLDNAVDHIRERTGCDRISVLGYCMGGTMAAIYAALRPEKIRNLILLTAPIDWSHRENLLSLWADEKYFNIDRAMEVMGNAHANWLQASFLLLKPVQNLVEKYFMFYENMEDEKFLEDFFAMETWLNDNIPVAGEIFRQFVKYMFQQNQLIRGRLEVGNERVDLRKITCPVLNLIAKNDHLVPPNQSLTFNDAVSSNDKEIMMFPAGHIGMAVGGKAHRELWPQVCDWLRQRSEPSTR